MCIAQFNLYLVVLVVAILLIKRPAIASHNLARFNPGINPRIPGLSKLNPEIPGLAKRSGIEFPMPDMQSLDRRIPLKVVPFNSPRAVSLIIAINIIVAVAVGGSVIEISPLKDSDSPVCTCLTSPAGGGDPLQTLSTIS